MLNNDIVPDLLEKIKQDFFLNAEKSSELEKLLLLLKDGKATYKESYRFATKIGEILSKVLQENINNDVLPEGKMHFNIANRILNEMLETNHKMVSSYAKNIQEELNKQAGLGLKSVIAPINQDRIDGLVNRLSHESSFDDVSWILGAPVVNFSQNVVDNHIQANAEFHYKSGLKAKVVRTTNGKCCEWCDKLAGVYFYPKVDKNVFRRHDRCDCTVEYYPGDGKKQDVWSKRWSASHKSSIIDTKRLDDIILPKSISAKARDIYVKVSYPVRGTVRIKQGSTITNVNVIAGKDVKRQIDDIRRLTTQYKTKNEKMWQKITGIATLENDRVAELHWYQHPEVGKVEFKVKRFIK